MRKRLLPLAFIFLCTSIAWMILGHTINDRTTSADRHLREQVQSVWGAPQVQIAPVATYMIPGTREYRAIRPYSSEVAVDLASEPCRKGLLWYPTYKAGFRGSYVFANPTPQAQTMRLTLQLPAARAIYDGLQLRVDKVAKQVQIEADAAFVLADVPAGQAVELQVSYRSQGLESWRYSFGPGVAPVQNFHLRMTTNFEDIDFPDDTLAPSEEQRSNGGWQLDWRYKNLLSANPLAMAMPENAQPGPLAAEISYFAPVSLFFFCFALLLITTLRDIDLHPMNYFFLACAFFTFHLLLAYLADRLDIHVSFLIAAVVSVLLVVTYLRLVVGTRFALREAAAAQIVYLVLFSYAFFFKGFTGLTITTGAIVTLFVAMQMTGRIRWEDKFGPTALAR